MDEFKLGNQFFFAYSLTFQHFLDFVTKDYVEDWGMIPLEYLQEADVRLVVVGHAPYKFIQVGTPSDLERNTFNFYIVVFLELQKFDFFCADSCF